MDNNMRRSIILDNYEDKDNRYRVEDSSYIKHNSRNVSCIDNIDLYIKVEDNIIKDIKFEGEACVISISTTSIMSKLLIGKSVNDAINIIKNYDNMVEEKEYDKDILEEAIVFDDIYKQPARKKCATLTWHGLLEELEKLKR